MVKSMYSSEEFYNVLDLHNFDFVNYVPVFVVFHEKKNNGYTNRNKKYFYKMHKNLKPTQGEWVTCPVYEDNRFQVGRIAHVGRQICYETVPEIASMIEGDYPSDYIENCRSVAARVNQEDMQNYHRGNLNRKVRSKLEKELFEAFDFESILSYVTTGSFGPKVELLLNRIEKIDKGEYL